MIEPMMTTYTLATTNPRACSRTVPATSDARSGIGARSRNTPDPPPADEVTNFHQTERDEDCPKRDQGEHSSLDGPDHDDCAEDDIGRAGEHGKPLAYAEALKLGPDSGWANRSEERR